MSTLADVHAAEEVMINAVKALRAYADKTDKDLDVEARLIAESRKAKEDYFKTVVGLGSN